jgi:small-conductance mechanosensitive channel
MILEDLFQFLTRIHPETPRLIAILIIIAVVSVFYKIFSRSITCISRRLEFDPHIQNSLRLVLRVLTLLVLTTALFTIHELPTTWFVGSSALIGAAIGFGSSQTINNIVAGFYVIAREGAKISF